MVLLCDGFGQNWECIVSILSLLSEALRAVIVSASVLAFSVGWAEVQKDRRYGARVEPS